MNKRKMRLYVREFDDKIAKGDVRSKMPEAVNERLQKIARAMWEVERQRRWMEEHRVMQGFLRESFCFSTRPITCSGLMTRSQLCGEDNWGAKRKKECAIYLWLRDWCVMKSKYVGVEVEERKRSNSRDQNCSRSLKSCAANFFISDTLLGQLRIVDPKLEIWRYLQQRLDSNSCSTR